MVELQMEDMNETELRLTSRSFGIWIPRTESAEAAQAYVDSGNEALTDQMRIRTQTEAFVVKNWPYLKHIAEVYGCTANCTQSGNRCTDARAQACYSECFPATARKRR